MPARRALATIAAVTFGAVAIGAAVGATTRVFNVAEASPGVGRVSPVSIPTLPPVVAPRAVDVEDALPTGPVGSVPPVTGDQGTGPESHHLGTTRAPSLAPTRSTTTSTLARHEAEHHGEDD